MKKFKLEIKCYSLNHCSKQHWLSDLFEKNGGHLEDITHVEVVTTGPNTSTLKLTNENEETDDASKASGETSFWLEQDVNLMEI